ncbi:hypothetical protein [Halegenticoccus soli]|nr:hypothetical protein [Halegenticoccus soli]
MYEMRSSRELEPPEHFEEDDVFVELTLVVEEMICTRCGKERKIVTHE